MSARIIAALRAARQSWVELEPGKRVQIIRPPEAALHEFSALAGENHVDRMLRCVVKYVTGWEGITEADLLGAALAPADVVPFESALWATVVADRMDWIRVVMSALVESINAHDGARQAAEKN